MSQTSPEVEKNSSHDSPKKDWEISTLYSKSWEIVKNNKVTWIFGAAVASMMGGSSSFNSSGDFDTESFQKLFNQEEPAREKISQVLGSSIDPITTLFNQIVQTIPFYYYVIFALEIIFLIVVGFVIRCIYSAWAHASLIESVNSAYHNHKPTIADSSQKGFAHIKSFVLLELIPMLFYLVVIPASILIFALGFSVDNFGMRVFLGVLVAIEVCLLIYVTIVINIGMIWAYREIAISDKGVKESFWDGIKIARKKFWGSLGVGALNVFLSGIVGAIPLLILIALIGWGVYSYLSTEKISPEVVLGIAAAVIVYIPVSLILGGMIHAFKASVWTIAYDNIKGKYTK